MLLNIMGKKILVNCSVELLISRLEKKYYIVSDNDNCIDYSIHIIYDEQMPHNSKFLGINKKTHNLYENSISGYRSTVIQLENNYVVKQVCLYDAKVIFNSLYNIDYVESCIELLMLNYIHSAENVLTLHASAIEKEGSVIVFLGDSGSGKSTMAMLAAYMGFNVIENENVIINFKDAFSISELSGVISLKTEGKCRIKEYLKEKEDIGCKMETREKNRYYKFIPKQIKLVFLDYSKDSESILVEIDYANSMTKLLRHVIIPDGYFRINKMSQSNNIFELLKRAECYTAGLIRNRLSESEKLLMKL